jgi:hypothetical protein
VRGGNDGTANPCIVHVVCNVGGLACRRAVPGLHLFQRAGTADLSQEAPGARALRECHSHGSPPLQPLAPEAVTWNEDQSRANFSIWRQFVVPGNPLKSPLLLHPLAMEAGGDHFHAGGKHWKSQSDPEWQTLAAWVNGQTIGGSK